MKNYRLYLKASVLLCLLYVGPNTLMAQDQQEHKSYSADSTTQLHLSLDDALKIAISDNPTVRIARTEVKKTEYARNKSFGSLFPKVDLNGTYNHTIKKQKMYFGGMKFPGMGGGSGGTTPGGGGSTPGTGNTPPPADDEGLAIEVGVKHTIQAGVQAGMPLIAPQLWQSININATNVELAKEKSRASKIDMTAEVRKAYYTVLLAQEAYQVYKQSYDNACKSYKQIEDKYKHGLVAQYDLLRTEVQMKNLEPNVIQAEQSIVMAKKQLKVLLDLDLETPITLSDSLNHHALDIYKEYLTPVDTMLHGNSTLKQLEIQGKLLHQNVQMAKMAFLPTLSLGFVYNYNYMGDKLRLDNSKRWTPYSMINLTLSIPIFNGGSKWYEVKMQQAARQKLELNKAMAQKQMQLALQNQQDQLTNAAKRYVAAKQAITAADKGYQIASLRYKTGESTLVELNDADLALLQARLNYSQAIFDFLKAKADLDKIMGYSAPAEPRNKDK